MKRMLIFLVLLVTAIVCWGQYGSAVMEIDGSTGANSSFNVIRKWDDTRSVILGRLNQKQCFWVVEQELFMADYYPNVLTYSTFSIFFNDSLYDAGRFGVTDFSLLGDTLVFCATTEVGKGMIGWFRLSTVPPSPGVTNFNYVLTAAPMRLHKVLAYLESSGLMDVIAIGYDVTDKQNVIHIKNIMSAGTTTYHYYNASSSPSGTEQFDDMVQSGNNVILVGSKTTPGGRYLCIRYGDRNNFYYSAISSCYTDLSAPNEVNATVVATRTIDGLIALSYMHIDAATSQYLVRTRLIKVSSGVVSNIHSQEMAIDNKYDPTGIEYLPENNSVVLLQEYHNGIDNATKFFLLNIEYPYSYMANYLYFADENFLSLSEFEGHCYSAVSTKHLYQQNVYSTLSIAMCPSYNEINVDPTPALNLSEYTPPYSPYYNPLSRNTSTITASPINMLSTCDNPKN